MAKASLIQTNFTGGELSPSLALGRVDIAKYANGVRRLENCTVTVQGGAKRRPGTRFIARAKDQATPTRLVEFIFNRGQAYVLELGAGYMRFFRDRQQLVNTGVPVELVTPYSAAQLQTLSFVQKSDTAFFVHEAVYPQRLQRFSNLQWGIGNTPFLTAPYEEQGHFPATTLALSANTGTVTVTAAAAAFLPSDVGRVVSYGGGSGTITVFTSDTSVSVLISTPFQALAVPVGWNLGGSPQDSISPSSKGDVGEAITLSANYTYYEPTKTIVKTTAQASWRNVEVTAHGYSVGDTVQLVGTDKYDGVYVIDTVPGPNFFTVLASGGGLGNSTTTGTAARLDVATGSKVWRAEDVGKLVQINGGLLRITAVADDSVASAEVLRPLTSDVPASKNSWILSSDAWNAISGYPRAVSINTQRLMYGGSPAYPQHIWASTIQEYLDFSFGTADDEAFRFELDGPRNSPIRHIAPSRKLLILTESDEMSLKGGQEKPITPTNITKTDESTVGASGARPVKIGNEMLFVQAAGKKVAAAGYRYEIDGFASPARTVFASHITGPGVSQLAHQKEPDSTLFAVRTDGVLAVCAYDIDQEVTGWGRWITQGAFESVAVIPTPTGEDAYVEVSRAGGRFIEVFDPDMYVDSGISGSNPAGQATWTGLGHLEGQVVQARADGAYLGEYTVSGGAVTLGRPAKEVQIGLAFTCLVEMLQIEVGGNGTTAQGSQVHVNEVIIRLLDTQAAVINGEELEFRKFGSSLLDLPPPVFSGDVRTTTLSDEVYRTSQIITQPYPMPFHLLDVIRRVTLNDG